MKLSLKPIFKSSWLPHSTYMYLDFHLLCSITKPKEHRREIFYSKSPRSPSHLPRFNWSSWIWTSEDSSSLTSAKATLTKIQGEKWNSSLLSISWITQTNRVQDIKAHTDQVPPSTMYQPVWPYTDPVPPVSPFTDLLTQYLQEQTSITSYFNMSYYKVDFFVYLLCLT